MQPRWASHVHHPFIVVAPASVQEIYTETARAFDLAEEFRTPVVVLYDEVIAHLTETVTLPEKLESRTRKFAKGDEENFLPYADAPDHVPLMARPGDGHRVHVTGLTHLPDGFPTQKPDLADKALRRLMDKIETNRARIEKVERFECDDAEILVVAIGVAARAARRAVQEARAQGIKAGLLRPVTLWPFPETAVIEAASRARRVLAPEMNLGQMALEVERLVGAAKVARLNRIDGEPISPAEIVQRIRELAA